MKTLFLLFSFLAILVSSVDAQSSVRSIAKNLSTGELIEGFKSGAQTVEITSTGTLKWNTGATLTNASAFRASAGVAIGSDVQGYSSTLASIAAGTWTGATSLTTLGTIGTGTWQGTAIADAYIASAATWNAKESALTFSTGLTRSTNTITVNTTQNIAKLSNLSTNGFVKTTGADGTLSVDTSTYLTANETITLSGDISGSGTTAITTTIGAGKVTNTMLAGSIDLTSKVIGALPIANGGTGQTTAANAINALVPSQTGNSGKVLTTDGSVVSWGAGGSVSAANPTASIGLTAVNGSATTFMRSDAAPALDVSITPTWTGQHTFAAGTLTTSKPLTLTQTWNAGGVTFGAVLVNVTSTASAAASLLMDLQLAGVSKLSVRKDGRVVIDSANTLNGSAALIIGNAASQYVGISCYNSNFQITDANGNSTLTVSRATGNTTLPADAVLGFSSATTNFTSGDTLLGRLSAGVFICRNSTTAQSFLIANTYTSTTSYEAAGTWWSSNVAYIGTQKGSGGGSARDVSFVRDSTVKETLGANTNDDAQARKLYSCTYTGRPNAATVGAGSLVYMTACNCTVAGGAVTATGTGVCIAVSDGTNWIAVVVIAAGA